MEDKPIKIVIPIEPRTKKNSQQIIMIKGRPIIVPSKQYKAFEKACKEFIPTIDKPIDYTVNVQCKYYMPTRRKCDLTNLLEATDDVLVHYGVLEDDDYSVIYSHDGSRVYYDKENPRTEILIVPISQEDLCSRYLDDNYSKVYEEFCECYPEKITSDFSLEDLDYGELEDFIFMHMIN